MMMHLVLRTAGRRPFSQHVPKVACFRNLSNTATETSQLVLNAMGLDRLGIVSDMTQQVTKVGGSVGESQATKLGSYFSLTMLVTIPTKELEAFQSSLGGLPGLQTHCLQAESSHSSSSETGAPPRPARVAYSGQFKLTGADHPGLVNSVTSALAKHGLSIDTMETSDEAAAYGQTLFSAEGIATATEPLAQGFDADKIREDLEKLGDSLNCDITLEDNVMRKSRLSTSVWVNMA